MVASIIVSIILILLMGGLAFGAVILNLFDKTRIVETIMNIDLNQFAKEAYTSAKERQENGANISVDTLKMLKHTATEVIEATEAYSVEKYSAIDDEAGQKEKFASELADIVACVLIIAYSERIDINEALVHCLYKNKKRAEMTGDKL